MRALVDETGVIRAEGLKPNERVLIRAALVDGANEPWSSQADFLADAKGAIDTSKQAPVKGSYNEVSAMGLVWSMKSNAKHVPSYQPQRDLGSQVIEFSSSEMGSKWRVPRWNSSVSPMASGESPSMGSFTACFSCQTRRAHTRECWWSEDPKEASRSARLHGSLHAVMRRSRSPTSSTTACRLDWKASRSSVSAARLRE
jgi:Acyl-CoA thioester hydrolase/BAAT N-terminal region